LDVRFRGAFCYLDAFCEARRPTRAELRAYGLNLAEYLDRVRSTPIHLCRMRYLGRDQWNVAFFTYSHEKYEPCVFPSGSFFGTPEEALDLGTLYLQD
jgi:hypothetical protein